jgi:hypothetical protein
VDGEAGEDEEGGEPKATRKVSFSSLAISLQIVTLAELL